MKNVYDSCNDGCWNKIWGGAPVQAAVVQCMECQVPETRKICSDHSREFPEPMVTL